jgi:flagellar motor switch protein FliN/FliY
MPEESVRWLLETWIRCLEEAVEELAGVRPRLAAAEPAEPEGPVWWRRDRFGFPEGAAVWTGAPPDLVTALGKRVLAAAGAGEADADQVRSTYAELIDQATGMLAAALEAKLGKEIRRVGAEEIDGAPPEEILPLTLQFGGEPPYRMWVAFEGISLAASEPAPPAADQAVESRGQAIDLLLDVELPVSISFGRTQLPLKEVLQLTSGSIVELNRAVSDPVEVIVNNCVIARGEVVVVEGNYGVRIQEIVSRQQRLRTVR